MDFKRYGEDGLLVIAKYPDVKYELDKNQTHQAPVTFKNDEGSASIEPKTWVGHAQSEKIGDWKARGWRQGVLDGIHGFTERVHDKNGEPTERINFYEVGPRRIAVMHKGDFFRIVTRPAQGAERLVAPRFPLMVNRKKKS